MMGHHTDLLTWIMHAAVWHLVSRVLYRLPLPVDVALVVVGYLLYRARARRRRGSRVDA